MDKWLWAARFFKTRSLAAGACELGRIESGGHAAKPAREVKVGDVLKIRNEGGLWEIAVAGLSEMRGPASVAQTLYQETEASRVARAKAAEERRNAPVFDRFDDGRPSKKDRRDLNRVRGR